MKALVRAMVVAGLIGAVSGAASAQTDAIDPATMTCADFMAMSQDDRTAAMEAMGTTGAMATGEAAADDLAADQMATEDMASDDMAAADTMASERMTAMTTACEGAPDMMATDALTSAMEN